MGTRRIRRDDGDFTLFFRKVSPFSNHHPVEFDCEEAITFEDLKRFCCTEQYYMYNKAMMTKDQKLMTAILNSDSPREMKAMCSRGNLRGWSDEQWDGHKMTVMDLGSFAKYDAAVHLRYALFLTMGSKLVECNPYDNIWGIGKDLQAAERGSLDTGENLLGKILDLTRDKMWERHAYGLIEVKTDRDYMMKAMKQVDLLYKARFQGRFLIAGLVAAPFLSRLETHLSGTTENELKNRFYSIRCNSETLSLDRAVLVCGFIGWYWRRFQGAVDGVNVGIAYAMVNSQFIAPRTSPVLKNSVEESERFENVEAMEESKTKLNKFLAEKDRETTTVSST